MRAALLVLALAACTSPSPAPIAPAPAPPPAADPPHVDATPAPASAPDAPAPAPASGDKTDGTQGAVCSWGTRSPHRGEKPAACQTGLRCCYSCGMPGCNSVCMARTECPQYP